MGRSNAGGAGGLSSAQGRPRGNPCLNCAHLKKDHPYFKGDHSCNFAATCGCECYSPILSRALSLPKGTK